MSDDLNTEIKIGADASGVEAGVGRAKRSLSDLGAAAKRAGKEAGDGMASIGDGGDRSAKKVESATRSIQAQLQRLTAAQQAGGKESRAYWEALANTRGVSASAIKPYLDQLDAAKAKTLAAKGASESWTASLGKVGPAIAAAFAGAGLLSFTGKLIAVQREFDVLNSSLKTVTGSSAAAEKEMAWLKDFAKETPFGLAQATQGFVKMKALGLDPTKAALTSFGNTASAMGKDLSQMIEAVADASTGEFERLKEFGIKASKEGDKVSLTFQGVTKTIGNSAAEITKYLEDIGNVSFAGAMAERAQTLDGVISALGDTWDELFRTISTNNAGSLIFDAVTLASGAIEDATSIIKAMSSAADENGRATGAMAAIQNGIGVVFETVAVLGVNLKYILVQIGDSIGGLAAQVAAAARLDFSGVAAIQADLIARGAEARKQVDETSARILGARKAAQDLATWKATGPNMPEAVKSVVPVVSANAAAMKAAAAEAKKLAEEQRRLVESGSALAASLLSVDAGLSGDFAKKWDSLGAAYKANAISLKVLIASQAELLSQQPGMKAAVKAMQDEAAAYLDTQKELNDAYVAESQAREQGRQSVADYAQGIAESNEALQYEYTLMGLSEQAREIALEQYRIELDLKKQIAAVDASGGFDEAQREEERARLRAAAASAMQAVSGKVALGDWKESVKQYDDIFRKGFAEMVNGGKGAWKSFTQSLVTTFKTSVADQIYKMFAQPFVMKLVASLIGVTGGGLAGAANAATGGGSATDMLGMGKNALSMNTGWFTDFGATAVGSMSSTGAQLFSKGFETAGNAMMDTANSLAQYSDVISGAGDVLGYAGALYSLSKGNYGAAAGAAIGTYFGGPIGSFIGSKIGGLLDKEDKPTASMGESQIYFDASGAQSGQRNVSGMNYNNPAANASADAFVKGMQASFAQIATSLGATMAASGFSYGGNTGKGGESPNFAIGSFAGSNSFYSGEQQVTDGAVQEAASRAVFAALQGSQLPKYLQGAFDGMAAGAMSQDDIGKVLTAAQGLKAFHDELQALPFGYLKDMSFGATQAMIGMAGGLDNLKGALGGFYENFYTDEEKARTTRQNIAKSLNAVGLGFTAEDLSKMTRPEFRKWYEDIATQFGADNPMAMALLSVSQAFASVTPVIESIASAVETVTDSISDTMKSLQADATSLQIEIMRLNGDTGQADYAQRALDTTGYSAAEVALYDYNAGLRAQVETLASLKSLGANALNLQIQMMRLQGDKGQADYAQRLLDTAGYSAAELAIYDYNAGLQKQIEALTAAQNATAMAKADLVTAYQAEAAAMQTTVDKFRTFAASLRSFRDGLLLGSLSPLTPGQRYAESTRQFDQTLAAAMGGDEAAMGKLQGASTALLEASKVYNASGSAYLSDFARVQAALGDSAISAAATADVAQLQLDAIKSQLSVLGSIDRGVMSVADALAAQAVATAASGVISTGGALAGAQGYSQAWMQNAINENLAAGYTADQIVSGGISNYGISEVDLRAAARAAGIPGFRVGTNYVQRDMLAQIHEGEAIVPRAYNPAAGGQSQSNAALEAKLDAVIAELNQLRRQQSQETGALIAANYDANVKNANAITTQQSRTAFSKAPALA